MTILDFFFPGKIATNRLIAHLETEVNALRQERDVWAGKCARLEAIMMPMSSPAGAAYVRSLAPKPQLPRSITEAPPRPSWAQVQADWAAQQEKEIAAEQAEEN